MEKMLDNFVGNLKEAFSDRLSSVFVYGSYAVQKSLSSDVNLIVIVKDLSAADLKKANSIVKKISKKTKALPIFMDREEWFNSSDVYAIECSDIKDRNRILYGEDLISQLSVDRKDLRLQCENEVKNLLIRLRQTYLISVSDKKVLQNLIKGSSKTFMVIFRTILRLTSTQVSNEHSEVLKSFANKMDEGGIAFDLDMFLKILEYRKNPRVIKNEEEVVQKLIDTTNSVLKYVDKLA